MYHISFFFCSTSHFDLFKSNIFILTVLFIRSSVILKPGASFVFAVVNHNDDDDGVVVDLLSPFRNFQCGFIFLSMCVCVCVF